METRFTLEELNAVAEIEIVYRNNSNIRLAERPQIISSKDAYDILLHYWNKDRIELVEEFKVLYMNQANRVLRIMNLSSGTMKGTMVDVRMILVPALKLPTTRIILAHNHPSGNLIPSKADITVTDNISLCANLFDIRVTDHLVITCDGYYSFADNGLL